MELVPRLRNGYSQANEGHLNHLFLIVKYFAGSNAVLTSTLPVSTLQ